MRQHRLQAPGEKLKLASLFVNLYSLPIILDFCIHSIWTFPHRLFYRLTSFSLKNLIIRKCSAQFNISYLDLIVIGIIQN